MGLKRVSYLVGCFVYGLVVLLIIVANGEDDDNDDILHRGQKYSAIYNFGDSNSESFS